MSDELMELVGLDPDDHEAREALQDAGVVSRLIETLVNIRHDRELSQKIVAERMGSTQSTVSEFERIGTDPHISTLQRYGRAVGARIACTVFLDGGWTRLDASVVTTRVVETSDGETPLGESPWRKLGSGPAESHLAC